MGLFLFLLIWVVCGVIAWGACLGDLQRPEWAYFADASDVILAGVVFLFGPLGLIIAVITSSGFKHGFRFIPVGLR